LLFLNHLISGAGTPPITHDKVVDFLNPIILSVNASCINGGSFVKGAVIFINCDVTDGSLFPISFTAVTRKQYS